VCCFWYIESLARPRLEAEWNRFLFLFTLSLSLALALALAHLPLPLSLSFHTRSRSLCCQALARKKGGVSLGSPSVVLTPKIDRESGPTSRQPTNPIDTVHLKSGVTRPHFFKLPAPTTTYIVHILPHISSPGSPHLITHHSTTFL